MSIFYLIFIKCSFVYTASRRRRWKGDIVFRFFFFNFFFKMRENLNGQMMMMSSDTETIVGL